MLPLDARAAREWTWLEGTDWVFARHVNVRVYKYSASRCFELDLLDHYHIYCYCLLCENASLHVKF